LKWTKERLLPPFFLIPYTIKITWDPIRLLNFITQTICRSQIVKLSSPGTSNKEKRPSICGKNFWITVFRMWIF
jgi:hypothetical protein